MGNLQAQEFARLADLDTALTWHATGNHYPPLPLSLVPVWKKVIEWTNDGNNTSEEFELPEGISYKGRATAPAWAIIENNHLDPWIEYDEEF
jgi:hypothetical protein